MIVPYGKWLRFSELLFHVISHLSASDLLSVKLVSRRFYDIVKSPHAWIEAFSRYFPGPDALARTADASTHDDAVSGLRSEKRVFTRLNATPSWTSEFLSRTKLLRCLTRGKPAIPFAAPSPGKSNKGYATFTYGSRLNFGISHLNAKFGPILDKRQPHFTHGFSKNGTVSSSDRRGKLDGWGMLDQGNFQTFAHFYPGTPHWGLGPGEITGIPNVMDLSSIHGMVYGEGIPGGAVYYLANGEKHGRYLRNLPSETVRGEGVPKISLETTAVCSVWIAKTPAVPRMTKGCIGLLCGASNGVVSAFSFGDNLQKLDRGELTARWILSPGVPIISVVADEEYSEERHERSRVLAFAINALGEIFFLRHMPRRPPQPEGTASETEHDLALEARAWTAGASAPWQLVGCSRRSERSPVHTNSEVLPTYYPGTILNDASDSILTEAEINSWLSRRPIDIRSDFKGWDMRRRVEVDFSGDDGKGGGENIVIFECGDEDDQPASAQRYTRCSFGVSDLDRVATTTVKGNQGDQDSRIPDLSSSVGHVSASLTASSQPKGFEVISSSAPTSSEKKVPGEWRCSRFLFGRTKAFMITTTAIDSSSFATTTCAQDVAFRTPPQKDAAGPNRQAPATGVDDLQPLKMPGQRARFIAAGTSNGKILIWNIRAPPAGSATVVNDIRPVRIIYTESPEISALALTSLYLVHGGSEGLVQAWDPLASSLEPIRTISSRNTLNARRRAVIAAQQNPIVQAQMTVSTYAATAICLDPDPTVLRGIVAIGAHLRYWSFSSDAANNELSKTQKRKINRAARGLTGKAGEGFMGTRRLSLKGIVNQDLVERALDDKDKRAEAKEQRRLAGRFGLDLLGPEASEEELIAYATLLSEEHHKAQSPEGRLGWDASLEEIEQFKKLLNEEDLERWQYASWEERFGMPKSSSETPTAPHAATPHEMTSQHEDTDLEKAIHLSLTENATSSPQARTPMSPRPSHLQRAATSGSLDDEIAEAIRLSLTEAAGHVDSDSPSYAVAAGSSRPAGASALDRSEPSSYKAGKVTVSTLTEEDELAEAIRLSLQDQQLTTSIRASWSPIEAVSASNLPEDEQFPALATPSPGAESPPQGGARRRGKGKGKGSLAWS